MTDEKKEEVVETEIPVVEEEVQTKKVDFSNEEFEIKLSGAELDFVIKAVKELPIKSGGYGVVIKLMQQLEIQAKVKLKTEEIIKNKTEEKKD